jgi:hypothetical protein
MFSGMSDDTDKQFNIVPAIFCHLLPLPFTPPTNRVHPITALPHSKCVTRDIVQFDPVTESVSQFDQNIERTSREATCACVSRKDFEVEPLPVVCDDTLELLQLVYEIVDVLFKPRSELSM